jgi:hypothetical protein
MVLKKELWFRRSAALHNRERRARENMKVYLPARAIS